MTTVLLPDAEQIVGDYLRAHADIAALGPRIVGTTPSSTDGPWVRITQLDAANEPGSRVEHLIGYPIQLDCYAGRDGGQEEASILVRTVRAVLHAMPDHAHDEAVVSRVTFTSCPRIPDQDFEPVRERYALTALVRMHAKP